MSKHDKSFLEWIGRQWRVQISVPAKLRPIIGKARLVVPLHTDSLAIANRDKHKHVHALKERLAAAEVELRRRSKGTVADRLVEEALTWREALRVDPNPATEEEPWGNADAALDARYEELVRTEGESRADMLMLIAHGRQTPISSQLDEGPFQGCPTDS